MIKKEKLGFLSFTIQSAIISFLMVFFIVLFLSYLIDPNTLFSSSIQTSLLNLSHALASSYLTLFLIISLPIISMIIRAALEKYSLTLKDEILLITDFLMVIIVMLLYPAVHEAPIRFVFEEAFLIGISFQLNMLSYTFILLAVLMWFFVMMYAHEYMKKENHNRRFFVFLSLSYAATLAIFIAGDLLSLFIAYEALTIMTYMLVAHNQTKESIDAANEYLFLGILGGFVLFVALALIYTITGNLMFDQFHHLLKEAGNTKYFIAGLLILGFGVKAGMYPVHVWLPKAHPVAPSPASALLSGIMIKVGVFGLLQSLIYFYLPETAFEGTVIGDVLIWIGMITMTLGMIFSFIQSNIKKLLAYSSVSQIGYIFMGLGVFMVLGDKGGVGLTGAIYHMINHALFKALLFMVAGLVILRTHEKNMFNLGGLYKKLPITAFVSVIASLGMMGLPLFNGYVSKVILHHAIVEAATYRSTVYYVAEWIFILVSAGTVATFIKFNYFIFFGKLPDRFKALLIKRRSVYLPMLVMTLSIALIGLFPRFLSQQLILPMIDFLPLDQAFTVYGVIDISYFAVKELLLISGIWALGFIIFITGYKTNLYKKSFPEWLNLEFIVLVPLSLIMHGLLNLIDPKHESINIEDYKELKVTNYKLTFKDHLVAFSDTLNQKYEGIIIQSDALIYAVFLTGVSIVMGLFAIFS
jgi:formate hydrogenlyase subunit 3/multisubunit Na+/H+ antiporter MnhD subunit